MIFEKQQSAIGPSAISETQGKNGPKKRLNCLVTALLNCTLTCVFNTSAKKGGWGLKKLVNG
jgi:hypothetical protein